MRQEQVIVLILTSILGGIAGSLGIFLWNIRCEEQNTQYVEHLVTSSNVPLDSWTCRPVFEDKDKDIQYYECRAMINCTHLVLVGINSDRTVAVWRNR